LLLSTAWLDIERLFRNTKCFVGDGIYGKSKKLFAVGLGFTEWRRNTLTYQEMLPSDDSTT